MSIQIRANLGSIVLDYEPRSFHDTPYEALAQLDAGYREVREWLLKKCGDKCAEEPKPNKIGFDAS